MSPAGQEIFSRVENRNIRGDTVVIRKEEGNDQNAIYSLVKRAFETAEHADGNEHDLVSALRTGAAYIPELSLVAEIDGRLAGHIMFTKAEVGGCAVLALAPLSVAPEYQRRGVGTALIQEGHRVARELGYGWSIVLGSEPIIQERATCRQIPLASKPPLMYPGKTLWPASCYTARPASTAQSDTRKNLA